jgi:hypothetical protein
VLQLLVTANIVPSLPILATPMKERIRSCETPVLTRARRRNIPVDGILHIHRRENLKSVKIWICIMYGNMKCQLTLLSSVPLGRPQVVQPLDNFPAFYGTLRYITGFTRALHFYLSRARPIQSPTLNPISKGSILMLSIHLRLGLPSVFFPLTFLLITYTHLSSPPFVPHVPPTSSSSTS